jgi:hypothetical protein
MSNPVTDFEVVGRNAEALQTCRARNAALDGPNIQIRQHKRQIGGVVGADNVVCSLASINRDHLDGISAADNVLVGDDPRVQPYARTEG